MRPVFFIRPMTVFMLFLFGCSMAGTAGAACYYEFTHDLQANIIVGMGIFGLLGLMVMWAAVRMVFGR